MYNTNTKEIRYNSIASKTFVIDHPNNKDKYLVHACLEGPEAGVYYRGEGKLVDGVCVVSLPVYVKSLATALTVQLIPVSDSEEEPGRLWSSRVRDGKLTVRGTQDC